MLDNPILWTWAIIAMNLVIAIAAMSALRFGSGVLFGVDSRDELAEKDNVAFGLALAGGTVALALILAGAGAGEAAANWTTEIEHILMYAITGIVLLKVGLLINDVVVFRKFAVRAAIGEKNIAAGTVQAANLLALGILIHAAIDWVENPEWLAMLSVVVVFLLAQIVVLGVTWLRTSIYARRHDGAQLQDALAGGNAALGLRYAGHLLGTALASSSAGGLVPYIYGLAPTVYLQWLAWAIGLACALSILSIAAQRIILMGIDVVEEVDRQQNLGVAAIEAAIFVGVGLVINSIIG